MDELDAAWARFGGTRPEWGGGLANHGPMVAEALVALGHPALVPAWVDLYAPRLPPLEPGTPIAPREREAALGDPARVADWIALFEEEVALRGPWEVLAEWVPRLLPGLFASAGHGLLRTAHAVRALEARDGHVRRRELAHGLGLWSARHQRLPGRPGARPARAPDLAELEPVPPGARRGGLFFDQVRVLERHPPFVAWVEGLDLEGEVGAQLGRLARQAAALYLEHPTARAAYAHVVTVPSALRLLAPRLPADAVREGLGYALQAAGALHAVSHGPAAPDPAGREAAERTARDPAETRYRAACSLDDHGIKLAEACLREDALEPHPVLRLAAADAALHLGGEARAC